MSANAVFTFGAYVRQDQYNYYPSNNLFADLGPTQQAKHCAESFADERRSSLAMFRM